MKNNLQKLTSDRPATYQIKVPGKIDVSQVDWAMKMAIIVESEGDGPPTTTLTGKIDQAALHDVICRIRELNAPLLSIQLVGSESETGENNL